ncbi:MAG: glycosyltransferase [Euryarchaeota archaeon]|nr:glycosyltransferase [Euryarchaeota archaeon]
MISVVIPAYNEANYIGELLEVFSAFRDVELIVAEDASTDGTAAIVQKFTERVSNVKITSSDVLGGKGAAIKRGLSLASGDILGFIDADLSIHPRDFMRVVAAIDNGADLAIGSRKLPESNVIERQPFFRRISGSVYSILARALVDTHVRDFQCGCKAFRRALWDSLNISCDGFAFDTELIAQAHTKGFAVVEVPITWDNKTSSKVKMKRDVWPMLKCLLRVRADIRG